MCFSLHILGSHYALCQPHKNKEISNAALSITSSICVWKPSPSNRHPEVKLLTQQHLYYLRVLWSTRKNSLCLDSSIPKKSSDSLRIWQNWVSSCTGNCDGIPPASCSVTIRDIHNIILCLCYKCSLGYNNSC
jgi:hypothetical protein